MYPVSYPALQCIPYAVHCTPTCILWGALLSYIHTEKCLVGFTNRWLNKLHDLVSYKATTYLVGVTNADSCNDSGNTTIWWVTLAIMGSYNYY